MLTDEIYQKLAEACPNIENLDNVAAPPKEVIENGVHEEDVEEVVVHDTSLQPLQVQSLFHKLTVVHDKPVYVYGRLREGGANYSKSKQWLDDLNRLSVSCPNVTAYRCRRGQRYLDNDGLANIGKLFTQLKTLELYHTSIDDEGFRQFFAHFNGTLCDVILDNPGDVTDEGLKVIALNCPKLEYLKLSHMSSITNDGIEYLVTRCKSIQELHLNNSVFSFRDDANANKCHFSNDCIQTISRNCPNLGNFRLLNSDAISHSGISGIAEGCRYLWGIMLYECPAIDDSCMDILGQMPFLKAVVLVNCDSLTPKGIINMVLHGSNLVRITLMVNPDKCTAFYGDHSSLAEKVYGQIDTEGHSFNPSVIRKLTVKGVGGNFLQLLTVLCPSLHTLDLRDAVLMNQTAFRYVLTNCEDLRVLDFQNVPNLCDAHLNCIVEHGQNVKKINLGRTVKNLSTDALAQVISHCPSLKYISMDFDYPIPVPGEPPRGVTENDDSPTDESSALENLGASGGEGSNPIPSTSSAGNFSSSPRSGGSSGDPDSPRPDKCPEVKHPDLNILYQAALQHHGGLCYLHTVTDEVLSPVDLHSVFPTHRHVAFHFTATKYLGSINTKPLDSAESV